ncbi:hypothetical protein RRU01S_36_00030 [Agrobacterium rubi TR3 = NBRC 13261]|uniref:GSCFA domain-containing protein n=1 Tax=Agrobacterium rubi TR3 = NBRC 13261 TaxID=1368415 RepID=A0A081D343_9HYPH|nr:GSCFA domain-containing protein [Agrobacterium rubi]MBP1881553.1 hypothetical protein [Agrobacterium rubi]GAK73339.1 hypothetical protein RRU01S_36_00030 [Agrobacterium rubi TR3 = NBRC 13261]
MNKNRTPNPYSEMPDYTRWSRSIAKVHYSKVDPVVGFPFQIDRNDKVATAGSCFAQHIARHLRNSGYNYFVPESAHPMLNISSEIPTRFNYGTFSARFGNIYTTRQLLQLMKRAYGEFLPVEPAWKTADGKLVDPFRPAIQPQGFANENEMEKDRAQHLSHVRTMFEDTDVFVFTLGLTEFWYCKSDEAALPICPGVAGGEFDETKYGFKNLSVDEVSKDLNEFIGRLKAINPKIRVILTVSPVPLAATAASKHVLVSTTYSKSVLRVAAEMATSQHENVGYFPSYEIITGNYNRGRYYDEGLREVTEEGVDHVMRLFMHHVAQESLESGAAPHDVNHDDEFYERMGKAVQTVCEEALLSKF